MRLTDEPASAEPLGKSELEQRDYYNRIAQQYDKHYANPNALRYREQVFASFLAREDWHGVQVLDAMCGGGENAHFFSQRGATVSGLDISEQQCKLFAQRHPGSEVICRSALDSGLAAESFDLVVTESLHHLHPHVNAGVAELLRVLRPGGQLLLWEPASGSLLDALRKLWYRLDRDYFQANEASIDIDRLGVTHARQLGLTRLEYGGNLGHLFVMSSMHFRIPPRLVDFYAPALLFLDRHLQKLQGRLFSCWVLALYEKTP